MQTRLRFLFLTFVAVALVATGCSRYSDFVAEPTDGDNPAHGNAAAGAVAMRTYGCSTCHSIPGIEGPQRYGGSATRSSRQPHIHRRPTAEQLLRTSCTGSSGPATYIPTR